MRYLNIDYKKSICHLTLNRPEKKNALNKELITELITFLEQNTSNHTFRVLLLSGSGGFFCAGADLGWMREGAKQSMEQNREDAHLFNTLYSTLYNFPKPVILQVEGGAYGGAIGFLACADVVTVSLESTFAFSETTLGLVPATVAPWMVLKTGISRSKELMLTSRTFDALQAKEMGLAHHLYSKEEITEKTHHLAEQIAKSGEEACQETKSLLNRIGISIVPIDQNMMKDCSSIIAKARISGEGHEGISAFFEKRNPSWITSHE